MSKWICGRLARPIASIVSLVMLVSLLLPLTPSPVQAQTIDLSKFFGNELSKPTPIVVVDFNNLSTYKTGMLGRVLSDSLSIELLNVKPPFEVIKRSEVDKVMADTGVSLPLTPQALAMIADRLHCSFTVSGDINSVEIHHDREGTYAEVDVQAVVTSKVTQGPINGARVIQRSSPKIGYSGSTDVLVHEALSTAAYQISQRLLDNRVPVATVLTSPHNFELVLKGGSTIGFRKGQVLTTLRREAVTGRVRLIDVTPTESIAEIVEMGGYNTQGIAPGDKAVPVFEFQSSARFTRADRAKTGLQIAGILGLAALAVLIGTENGDKVLMAGAITPTAAAMADANFMGENKGANLVTWPHMNSRVIAYVLYRDTNPQAPIAVVDGSVTHFVDSAKPLPELADVSEMNVMNITIDPNTGDVLTFTPTITYETTLDDIQNAAMTYSVTSYTVTSHRVPLQPGDTCGYQIQMLYYDYLSADDLSQTALQHPLTYQLYLGQRSTFSSRVTLTSPPTLYQPTSGQLPLDGNFRCTRVTSAMSYQLELSTSPQFPLDNTTKIIPAAIDSDQYALAVKSLSDSDMAAWFGQTIYWRMGAKVAGQPNPTAYSDPNENGWVYSNTNYFLFNSFPPAPPGKAKTRAGTVGAGSKLPQGRTHDGFFRR